MHRLGSGKTSGSNESETGDVDLVRLFQFCTTFEVLKIDLETDNAFFHRLHKGWGFLLPTFSEFSNLA